MLIQIVQTDIQKKAECDTRDPERLKEIIRSKQHAASQEQRKALQMELKQTEQRLTELDRLIPSTYEDKALGRIPESLCIQLMNQYETERQNKLALRAELSAKLEESQQANNGAEDWISTMREYDSPETLDRATLLRLIDRIEVGERRVVDGDQQREIRIRYKFVGDIKV